MVILRLVRDKTVPYWTRIPEDSQAVYETVGALTEDFDREAMWVACLDTKNKPCHLPRTGFAGDAQFDSRAPGRDSEACAFVTRHPRPHETHFSRRQFGAAPTIRYFPEDFGLVESIAHRIPRKLFHAVYFYQANPNSDRGHNFRIYYDRLRSFHAFLLESDTQDRRFRLN